MDNPATSAEMQKLIHSIQDSSDAIRRADDMGFTDAIIIEAKYLKAAIPHILSYIRTLEREHRAMREALENLPSLLSANDLDISADEIEKVLSSLTIK